jgi:hypothetical protein
MNDEINIFTWKGFEQCVREETAHLATLKSKSIWVVNFYLPFFLLIILWCKPNLITWVREIWLSVFLAVFSSFNKKILSSLMCKMEKNFEQVLF